MTRLREELAAHLGHPVEGTWPANGSNEVLTELLLAYGGPGRTAAIFEPTYLLHARLCWLTHTDVASRRLDDPFVLSEAAVDEALVGAPDVVFVCSPNNPTGTVQPLDVVAHLADSTDALVIVDEAYVEFGGESALKLVADHPNLAVVRTFSKAFAMAGARIGYVLDESRGRRRPAARPAARTICRRSHRPPGSSRSATQPRRWRSSKRSVPSAIASSESSPRSRA